MNGFLDKMAAVLDTPVSLQTRFREVDGWSSLMAFGLLVTLENDFGRRMTIDELQMLTTVEDIAKAAGVGIM